MDKISLSVACRENFSAGRSLPLQEKEGFGPGRGSTTRQDIPQPAGPLPGDTITLSPAARELSLKSAEIREIRGPETAHVPAGPHDNKNEPSEQDSSARPAEDTSGSSDSGGTGSCRAHISFLA